MKFQKAILRAAAAIAIFFSSHAFAQQQTQQASSEVPDAQQQSLLKMARDIHRQIVSLPEYGVFDHLYFGIRGGTVTLYGKASRPTLKTSAENVVKKVEGVKNVENKIEVLPLSPSDDRIRAAVYASIYRYGPLQRYSSGRGRLGPGGSIARAAGITNDPPIGWHAIHIVVQNGNVTLVGTVASEGDLAMAGMRANIVPGVFSVTNDLEVPQRQ